MIDEMRASPLNAVEYTKWPRLLLLGDPVTREQTNEILVRTTCHYMLITNDDEWEAQVRKVLGTPPDMDHEDYRLPHAELVARVEARHAALDARQRELGVLDLHYLYNERVMSCYADGPHGWCDWNGDIGATRYNVGKWPTATEVDCDLRTIAAAFPFLRMRVQLLSERYYEEVKDADGHGTYLHDDTAPVMWTVADGEVTYVIADAPPITPPTELSSDELVLSFSNPYRERGVTLTRLREAVAQVERTYTPTRGGQR